MKKFLLLLFLAITSISATAQIKDFDFKIYGQVRADLFYNSRANVESVDGLFYSYPKDYDYDAAGEDLNATDNSNMYLVYSRLGLDLKGCATTC